MKTTMELRKIEQIIENWDFEQIYLKVNNKYKWTFVSAFVVGILAHGMTMFDYLAHHDDIAVLFGYGRHYVASGRWFTSFLALAEKYSITTSNTIYPLPYCLCSLFFLSLVSCLLVWFLDIKRKTTCVCISCIVVAFPAVTSILGYLHIAPYFMFSVLLAIGGAILCCKKRNTWHVVSGIILMLLSIAIYQAFIPCFLSIFLIYLIKEIIDNPKIESKTILRQFLLYISYVFCVFLLYVISIKVSLFVAGVELTSYKGANNWNTNIIDHIFRIPIAFNHFFNLENNLLFTKLDYFKGQEWYCTLLLLIFLLIVKEVINVYRLDRINALIMIAFICMFPFSICFVYILCPQEVIHTPMLYSYVLVFVFFLFLVERFRIKRVAFSKFVKLLSLLVFFVLNTIFIKFDNSCYMKAIFNKNRAISYFTTMITRIKSVPTYTDEKKVVFINENSINDSSIVDEMSYIQLSPYWGMNHYLNDYVWFQYMVRWCGYEPELAEKKDFENLQQVREMPAYPDDGSIAVINNTIVVKLGQTPQ